MHFFCIQNTWNFLRLWKFHMFYADPSSRTCDIYLTFPLCIKNFMRLVNFLSLGHLTFPESVRNFTYPILKYMWYLLGISYTYLKFHMSCNFPKPRTCDIYLTFPESIRNFTCRILKYMRQFTWDFLLYLKFHMSCKFPKPRTCDIYLTFLMSHFKVHVTFTWHFLCVSEISHVM